MTIAANNLGLLSAWVNSNDTSVTVDCSHINAKSGGGIALELRDWIQQGFWLSP